MSIKTLKRIALGVVASLVFAPFAAIAPASAANITAITVAVTVTEGELVVTATIDDDDDVANAYLEVLQSPDPAVPVGLVTNISVDGVVTETAYVDGADEIVWTFDELITTAGLYRVRVFADADADAAFTAGTDVAALANFAAAAGDLVAAEEEDSPLISNPSTARTIRLYDADGAAIVIGTDEGWCSINTQATSGTAVYGSNTAYTLNEFILDIPDAAVITTTKHLRVTVSGPAIVDQAVVSAAVDNTDADLAVSLGGTRLDYTLNDADENDVDLPNSIKYDVTGVGSISVTVSEVVTATGVATALGTVSVTTLTGCDNGAYDSTKSGSKLQTVSTAITATTYAAGLQDEVGANKVSSRTAAVYLAVWLRDKYGDAMNYTSQALVATATNGAFVSWDGTAPAFATATTTDGFTNEVLWIKPGTAVLGTSFSTDVTITLNGVEVAKRTISFTGDAASITISSKRASIAAGEETADAFKVVVKDAAGNQIADAVSVDDTDGVYVTGGTDITTSTTAATGMDITCAARLGKGSVTLAYGRLGALTETVEITCAGGIASFEVSTNKTAYDRAEIGVFTITAKDSAGQPVADGTALASAAAKLQFTGSGATFAKTPAAADLLNDGKIDYAFTTSATAGSYNLAVWHGDLSPAVTKIAAFTVNAAAVAASYTKPTLTSSVEGGRVLLFGACQADEGDMVVYVKRPGGAWNEKAKTLECVAGEFDGSIKAPKSTRLFRVKQEGTGLWSGSVLARP